MSADNFRINAIGKIVISQNVAVILRVFASLGYAGYIHGGYVVKQLFPEDNTTGDYDMVCNIWPDFLIDLLQDSLGTSARKCNKISDEFDLVKFYIDGQEFEISCYPEKDPVELIAEKSYDFNLNGFLANAAGQVYHPNVQQAKQALEQQLIVAKEVERPIDLLQLLRLIKVLAKFPNFKLEQSTACNFNNGLAKLRECQEELDIHTLLYFSQSLRSSSREKFIALIVQYGLANPLCELYLKSLGIGVWLSGQFVSFYNVEDLQDYVEKDELTIKELSAIYASVKKAELILINVDFNSLIEVILSRYSKKVREIEWGPYFLNSALHFFSKNELYERQELHDLLSVIQQFDFSAYYQRGNKSCIAIAQTCTMMVAEVKIPLKSEMKIFLSEFCEAMFLRISKSSFIHVSVFENLQLLKNNLDSLNSCSLESRAIFVELFDSLYADMFMTQAQMLQAGFFSSVASSPKLHQHGQPLSHATPAPVV